MYSKINQVVLLFLFSLICSVLSASNEVSETELIAISFEEWEQKRKQYIPNILVVDMWAMWCVSCIERFPEMVRMHNQYQGQGVEFVSMNLDDRDDEKSLMAAKKFLQKMQANFTHYHMNENLMQAFEKIDLIGIPAVLIYDQNAKESYRLTGDNPNKQFTEQDVEEAINELLKSS